MKKQLLLLFVALLPLLASAQTKVEIDGIWYNLDESTKQAETTFKGDSYSQYSEYSGSITIPATVTYEDVDFSVTSVGFATFASCYNLTDITLPEGVTSIGKGAFYYCNKLTTITIPEGVTSIGEQAFDGCRGLINITIPQSVTNIGDFAFYECRNLTDITIPEGVTSIEWCAFNGCSSLTNITLPSSLTSIEGNAFSGCSSLTDITIPEGVTSIGGSAFEDCNISDITIPASVTNIEGNIFSGCFYLFGITVAEGNTVYDSRDGCNAIIRTDYNELVVGCYGTVIPEDVKMIGSSAFSGCCPSYIAIPKGVTRISYSAFEGCWLWEVAIPEDSQLEGIDDYAFYGCHGLTSIVLPKNLYYIGSRAFADCSDLRDVYCYAEMAPWAASDVFDGSYQEYATLHVPASALNAYKNETPWSSFGNFETLETFVNNITLSLSKASLTEGEELMLTATITPNNATDKSISWSSSNPSIATVDNAGKVTAVIPGTATITAMANDGSGVSASCEITVNKLILGKCDTPVISYVDGKVIFTCGTEEVTIISETKETNENIVGKRQDEEFSLIPTYTITAYATKEHYENSAPVTLTLCWIPCTEKHESEETGILTIPAKPVLISTQGGTITVSGLAADTEVAAYSTAGTQLATATATGGIATLATGLDAGNIAIVKIGEHSIKIVIK